MLQSVAMSLIFLPYGLRLEGSLPLWAYPFIGLVIFASRILGSVWCLGRYRFGPVEWVWRLVYGRVHAMRYYATSCRQPARRIRPDLPPNVR